MIRGENVAYQDLTLEFLHKSKEIGGERDSSGRKTCTYHCRLAGGASPEIIIKVDHGTSDMATCRGQYRVGSGAGFDYFDVHTDGIDGFIELLFWPQFWSQLAE